MITYRLLKTSWGILAYLSRNDKLITMFLPPALSNGPLSKVKETSQIQQHLSAIHAMGLSLGEEMTENPESLDQLAEDLKAYFLGQRILFTTAYDLSDLSDFTRKVLSATVKIPYGQTVSYGKIAKRIGRAKSFRAVARALAVNPIPIIIPCHRVIYSNGQLGGYSGSVGPAFKQRLLELERDHSASLFYTGRN